MQTLDTIFKYKPPFARIVAHCRLRIYKHDGKTIFLLTELPDNPGMSVTNAVELIATWLLNDHKLDPSEVFFIEHCPSGPDRDETYDQVSLNCTQRFPLDGKRSPWVAETPNWRRITLEEVEIMTGDNFSPMNQALTDLGFKTVDGRDFDDWDAWEEM